MTITEQLPLSAWEQFRGDKRRVFAVRDMPKPRAVREWSKDKPGSVYYRAYGLTHQKSNADVDIYLAESELTGIRQAQEIFSRTTGRLDPAWTYTGIARQLTAWLGVSDGISGPRFRELVPAWHYQECIPCRLPHTNMYDMRAAYWQLAAHADSPLLYFYGDKLVYRPIASDIQSRWDILRECAVEHKRLRLAIVGVNSVGWRKVPARNLRGVLRYCNGQRTKSGCPIGALRNLSTIAVRSTYEAVQIESAYGTVYSNGDCVTRADDNPPAYFDAAGIDYDVRAAGPTRIIAMNAYSIGGRSTRQFDAIERYNIISGPQRPKLLLSDLHWHAELLHCYDCLRDHLAQSPTRAGIL